MAELSSCERVWPTKPQNIYSVVPYRKILLMHGLNHLENVAFPQKDQRTTFQEVVLWVQSLYNRWANTESTQCFLVGLWESPLPSP